MTGYRVLLSCASTAVRSELFEPGEFEQNEAEAMAEKIMRASHGVLAYVVPAEADPMTVLHEKGWI